jgi:gas vesicle protein
MVYTINKNNKALHISTVLLALGVISFIVSTQFPYVPYLFQLAAIILLTFGIQMLQRYHLSDFKYIIDDKDDGHSFFNVIKIQGKKETMICSIDLCKCVYFGKPENFKEKTVNSFDSLNSTTVEYVTNLGKITKNIQELVDGIGQDYKQRIEDFENDRNTIINNTKIAIEQLSNSTESFKNSLLGLKKKLQYSLIFSIVTIIVVCVLYFLR